jgi:hypothetical protein
MISQRIALASAAALLSLVAPAASSAATQTTPILTNPTINGATNTNLNFRGFDNTFKNDFGIPLNAVLNNVLLTVKGTTGGSVSLINFVPGAPATVGSPGTFNLTVNGISPISQSNANSTPTIAGATTLPSYVPGSGTANITPTAKTFMWNVFNGGTLSTAPNGPWYASTVSLASLSDFTALVASGSLTEGVFSPPFTTLPGDNSTFLISSLLSETTLTYDWSTPTDVPGPLPLLGAAAAFGFSRRIRNRIKASV